MPKNPLRSFFLLICLINAAFGSSAIAVLPGLAQFGPRVAFEVDPASFPKEPGYFVIKGRGTIGNRHLVFATGIFLPPVFRDTPTGLPMVMTLHTRGASGSDGEGMAGEGLGMMLRANWPDNRATGLAPPSPLVLRRDARFIGIVPQCPRGCTWTSPGMPRFLCRVIDVISQHYHADDDRVYLTGFSYGASNTWLVALAQPNRFAGIAPMDGRATPDPFNDVRKLKNVAIFLSIGDTDGDFTDAGNLMHRTLLEIPHPNFAWNVVKDGNHFCYYSVYRDQRFWDWLLVQRRGQTKPPAIYPPPTTAASTRP